MYDSCAMADMMRWSEMRQVIQHCAQRSQKAPDSRAGPSVCVRLAAAKHRQNLKDSNEPCYGIYQLSCLIAMSNCLSDEDWHHTSQADKPCLARLLS